jgi:hypothetical protein
MLRQRLRRRRRRLLGLRRLSSVVGGASGARVGRVGLGSCRLRLGRTLMRCGGGSLLRLELLHALGGGLATRDSSMVRQQRHTSLCCGTARMFEWR